MLLSEKDDGAAGEHSRVVRVVVPLVVAQLLLSPRGPVVMRLADVEVTALRSVPRDVDVLAGCTHRDLGLVGPRHVPVDVHGRRPSLSVVGRLREHGRESLVPVAQEERRVDGPCVRDDLDRRVVLRLRPQTEANGLLRAPRGPVVRRDRHRYERRRAMLVAAGRIDAIPRRQQVCVWRGGIGGHGRLPVVGRGVHDPRAHPPRRGARSRDGLATELAGSLRLLERLDALGGLLRLLLELLRALGPRALAFALGLRLGLLCPCLGASGLRARAAAVSRVIASEGKVPQHYGQENQDSGSGHTLRSHARLSPHPCSKADEKEKHGFPGGRRNQRAKIAWPAMASTVIAAARRTIAPPGARSP